MPYYLHPESIYSVGLSKSSFRVKVSVGSNPWAPAEPTGESGQGLRTLRRRRPRPGRRHLVRRNREEAARKAAREIADELRASVRGAK